MRNLFLIKININGAGIFPLKQNSISIIRQVYESYKNYSCTYYKCLKYHNQKKNTCQTYVSQTDGILKLPKKLNVNKASGPDVIPVRLLKELSQEIAPFLSIIYKKCLERGSIPDVWRTSNVSAVYKKGSLSVTPNIN